MSQSLREARRELESIRSFMDRARQYRYLPPGVPMLAGFLSLGSAWGMHVLLLERPIEEVVVLVAAMWGGTFLLSLAAQLFLGRAAARREGGPWWSPLAAEILHTLWPPFLAGVLLTVAAGRAEAWSLVPSIWMLAYGVAGVAAGAYARPAVRGLGISFLIAGAIQVLHPVAAATAVGSASGFFHLVYGSVLWLRPYRG